MAYNPPRRPHFSQTLLIPHLYIPPTPDPVTGEGGDNPQEHFEEFFEVSNDPSGGQRGAESEMERNRERE